MNLAILHRYRDELRAGLAQALHGEDTTRQMLRYHVGLETAKGEPADHLGKLLRPSLVLFVADELGAERQAALPAAIALELIHNFSLIHDDIEDKDVQRRGRPTVWSLIGVAKAINAGDLMISLALLEAVKTSPEAVLCLVDAMRDLVDGQSLDLEFESRWVTPPEYRAMIQLKTGALFRCAFELAGIVANVSSELGKRLASFGEELGMAFQVRDDMLGVWGDERDLGRPPGSDLRRRKKAYPLVSAHERASDPDRQFIEKAMKSEPVSEGDIHKILGMMERLGIRSDGEVRMQSHLQEAVKQLPYIPFSEDGLQILTSLFENLTAFMKPRNAGGN
ncbi:polyprenyl synthetase family protein [Candidatus Bipolaricaulota bacterium]|nr:polyprenyl synthetase family protein [Candidatus Bipolaricaulota bacterium]